MSTTDILRPPTVLLDTFFDPSDDLTGLSLYTGDDNALMPTPRSLNESRPYVTLTFAQSLDAKIAGKGGKQLILSGNESMAMTHWMRRMHDAIMVGIGTALNDDPQLNTRRLPPLPAEHSHKYHLPRPVVLDTNLRLSSNCKLLKNYKAGNGRRPWIVTIAPRTDIGSWNNRRTVLEEAGVQIIQVESNDGQVHIPDLLRKLRELGVRSLMVEGGARVIQSFLNESQDGSKVFATVIVTVAPTFVGEDGVGYGANISGGSVQNLKHVQSALFGRDVVVVLDSKGV